jgi:hypothetical protein
MNRLRIRTHKEIAMKAEISSLTALLIVGVLSAPVLAQEKKAEAAKEKAKAEKVAGDIGLLDTEKNYMIVVTKDGKLVTLDYNSKTKVTELRDTKSKMADVGLGSSANVEYVTKGDKNYLTKMLFRPAKGE